MSRHRREPIQFYIDGEQLSQLDRLMMSWAPAGRSRSDLIREAVDLLLEKYRARVSNQLDLSLTNAK